MDGSTRCPICKEEIVRDAWTALYVHPDCKTTFHPSCLMGWLTMYISHGACPQCREWVQDFYPEDSNDIRFAHLLVLPLLEPYRNLPNISWTGRIMLPEGMWRPEVVMARRTDLEEKWVPYAPPLAHVECNYADFFSEEPVMVPRESFLKSKVRHTRFWNYHLTQYIDRQILICMSKFMINHPISDPRRNPDIALPPSPCGWPEEEEVVVAELIEELS